MKKMNINDAALHFGISKEAIHNRIRRGSLEMLMESDVKYVLVDENAKKESVAKTKRRVQTPVQNAGNERYQDFLEKQNATLQEKVNTLESETRELRDQKEKMLIEERQKIEKIYEEKDEQLKNFFASISSQFTLTQKTQTPTIDTEIEVIEEKTQESKEEPFASKEELQEKKQKKEKKQTKRLEGILSLKKYFKQSKLEKKKEEKIFKRFEKRYQKEQRIIRVGKKFYMDFNSFTYDDLLR